MHRNKNVIFYKNQTMKNFNMWKSYKVRYNIVQMTLQFMKTSQFFRWEEYYEENNSGNDQENQTTKQPMWYAVYI